ncbi:transposase, MuDR [Tanacetum coccineum]
MVIWNMECALDNIVFYLSPRGKFSCISEEVGVLKGDLNVLNTCLLVMAILTPYGLKGGLWIRIVFVYIRFKQVLLRRALIELKLVWALVPSLPKDSLSFVNVSSTMLLTAARAGDKMRIVFLIGDISRYPCGETSNSYSFSHWSSTRGQIEVAWEGFVSLKMKSSDIVQNGVVVWPRFLSDKYAVLSTCTAAISNVRDSILWRSYLLVGCFFTTIGSALSLCEVVPDSHEHLFFDCPFAAQVWNHMKSKAGLDNVPNDVLSRYYLWQERINKGFLIMMEEDYMPLYVIDPSNLKLKDYFRKEGIHFDPVQVYARKDNLFSIKLHHGGKFTPSPKRMYVGGKNYVEKIDMNLFNVDELHMFVKDLGYDPKQLMFYHYKFPNKSLDYGLRPLSCDADVFLSPVKCNVEIEEIEEVEEIDDDVLLNSHVVGSSKTLALCWINEADMGESSMDKNANVHEEQQTVNENMNVNADDENVNANDEYDSAEDEQDHVDDEKGRGTVREDFIVNEEHVVDEVEVNMESFNFSVQEQGADQTVTPNVDLTDEALEVLDFDSFDSDVGDDIESIRRRKLRKLRKTGGQSCGIVNTLFVGQEFANKELAKAKIKAHAVETRRKIRIVKNDSERLQAKCKGNVPNEKSNGMLPALKDLFPAAGHRYCIRNIHDNINLIYKGDQYKEMLWKYATATTEVHFERAMDEFNGANYDLLINNICEVFNRQFLEARDSPVITALEKWEVSGIPCKYVVACIFNMTDNGMQVGLLEDWVHQLMRLQTWKTVYSFKINKVPGREFWAKSQVPSRLIPPYITPQVGRPGKKRNKSAGEVTEMVKDGKLTRKGGTVTCCKCGQKGHNKRSCKGPSFPGSGSTSGAASQPLMASARASASASASQPVRASASQPASASASAKQPQRATSQPTSAPKTTRQSKTKNVAASAKKTPTRQSQRQKSAKKTPTTK